MVPICSAQFTAAAVKLLMETCKTGFRARFTNATDSRVCIHSLSDESPFRNQIQSPLTMIDFAIMETMIEFAIFQYKAAGW
mmetsp:Transcript_12899/g.23237  ORF Transcript_12899/g.23237 Transcript_12899/m.23237 type:complete len:81 (+) Transcript_12899:1474-1716(+)